MESRAAKQPYAYGADTQVKGETASRISLRPNVRFGGKTDIAQTTANGVAERSEHALAGALFNLAAD